MIDELCVFVVVGLCGCCVEDCGCVCVSGGVNDVCVWVMIDWDECGA